MVVRLRHDKTKKCNRDRSWKINKLFSWRKGASEWVDVVSWRTAAYSDFMMRFDHMGVNPASKWHTESPVFSLLIIKTDSAFDLETYVRP